MILTNFDFRSTPHWPGAFWSIWPEMALWVLWCPNGLRHINLDASVASWKKVDIFGIFGVQHANRGRTKYDIYSDQLSANAFQFHIKTTSFVVLLVYYQSIMDFFFLFLFLFLSCIYLVSHWIIDRWVKPPKRKRPTIRSMLIEWVVLNVGCEVWWYVTFQVSHIA